MISPRSADLCLDVLKKSLREPLTAPSGRHLQVRREEEQVLLLESILLPHCVCVVFHIFPETAVKVCLESKENMKGKGKGTKEGHKF